MTVLSTYWKQQIIFIMKFFCLSLLLLSVSRVLLSVWQWERVADFQALSKILVGGLRIDIASLCQLIAIPILLLILLPLTPLKGVYLHRFIRIWCWLILLFLVVMEVSTPVFIVEYDTRPHRLFFEYLRNPKEIMGMIVGVYFVVFLLGLSVVLLLAWKTKSWLKQALITNSHFSLTSSICSFGLLLLCVLGARSGLQHRPINPAMVAFTNDAMVNTLPLNSAYSMVYALNQLKHEARASEMYGELPQEQMLSIVAEWMPEGVEFIDAKNSTMNKRKVSYPAVGKNLIIVVEESLGARYVGSLGGLPLTPNIDRWKDKSWFLTNLYATGTRSARGLEVISSGFPPSPARAVLKLPKAQGGFFTLASLLGKRGYESAFIYGGESHFDNMKGFFLSNGFDQAIDQYDYKNPEYMGNWGVSDEDLFTRSLVYLQEPSDKPKFSLIFTSTNHTPFDFPDGKIELYDDTKQTVNNAIKYADFALGEFLDALESNNILDNSVVLVVADHDSRAVGSALVPVDRFHVPGFIIDKNIGSKLDNTLISHVDLAPTLLSLLGVDDVTPMIGQDLTQLPEDYLGRAIMQFGNNNGFLYKDELVVWQPDQKPKVFSYVNNTYTELDATSNPLVNTALAHVQFASWAYENEKYKNFE